MRYDRDGDQHYDVASAFIKSMRGSDVDAALHYLARMVEAGEDPRFIARRIVILASEDIGMADPTSLQVAIAASRALEFVGLPEARLALAQAVIHCALAPKSNAVITAYEKAAADVRAGLTGPVPAHLRDAHYPGRRQARSPARVTAIRMTTPVAWWRSSTRRMSSHGSTYYEPTEREPRAAERSAAMRRVLRAEPRSPKDSANEGASG